MNPTTNKINWLLVLFALVAAVSFFIPWVFWAENPIPGYALPAGDFFSISEKKFGLANPYPGFNIALLAFWLIPVGALAVLLLAVTRRNTGWVAGITGVLMLSGAAIYILFTNTLLQLGVGKSLLSSLGFGIYLTIIAGTGLILAGIRANALVKTGLVLAGPLCAWIGFTLVSKQLEGEKYDDSANVKSAYTVNGPELIREFRTNDSLANAKYREQVITVNGRVSETELPNDSTVNIKIADSTGSYLIFSFQDNYLDDAKKLKVNDSVSIRGSCSGGIYSEILETETITFKRCALLKL